MCRWKAPFATHESQDRLLGGPAAELCMSSREPLVLTAGAGGCDSGVSRRGFCRFCGAVFRISSNKRIEKRWKNIYPQHDKGR